ncbi:hypothetical protein [Roseibium aggregatum]|uniref:Uncharacterized protein n=1 Tax=Roseibium aggregatum TaxID=187304 RepID=A0A939EBX9_9HYPH|nr:hypothetical protein [Roseibium aggregatum]MBN9669070.1 hypothetical protein [Roseibium aggregatum]
MAVPLSAPAQTVAETGLSEEFSKALAAYDRAWETAGLGFATATLTEKASSGYGEYVPRETAAYTDGETLSIYAEPVGYGFAENDGLYSYKLTASYKLLNLSGQVLAEQDNFAEFTGSGRSKMRELSAALTFEFSGLHAGDYRLETSFTDEITGKSAGFTLPFTVSNPN